MMLLAYAGPTHFSERQVRQVAPSFSEPAHALESLVSSGDDFNYLLGMVAASG
jgi:hypothetical protein